MLSNFNADMVDGKHIWYGTKNEYNLLRPNDDPNTIYMIEDLALPVGPTGETGPKGDTGAPGEAGQSVRFWRGTQAQYDALSEQEKNDPNVLHLISDELGG